MMKRQVFYLTALMLGMIASGNLVYSQGKGGGKKPPPEPIDAAFAYVCGNRSGDLMVATEDGSQTFTVVSGRNATQPTFSPDGTRLAFVGWNGGKKTGHMALMTVNTDGTDLQELYAFNDGSYHYRIGLDWSPDGTKLAFSAQLGQDSEFWFVDRFLP